MKRLLDALKRVTLTQTILVAIAIFMGLNWWELRGISNALTSTAKQTQFMEGDLSDIETDLKDIEIDLDKPLPDR